MIRGRVLDPTDQQRETTDGKVWARLGMQVGGVTRRYSGGMLSSVVLEGRSR